MTVHTATRVGRPARRSAKARERGTTLALLTPPLVWLLLFFLIPVAFVAAYSFGLIGLFLGDSGPSLSSWRNVFGGSIYLGLFWKSIKMSLIVSLACVALAYPIAYYLAFVAHRRKYVLLLLIVAPFWTSFLLRVFAWKLMLGDQGLFNTFAYWTGLRSPDHPIPQLLYSRFSVILVLTYVWIPFVALPIFVSLETLDRSLLEAATDLGASRLQAFRRITLPLSAPGIAAAFVFVFIPTIGEFVTPLLVGGSRGYMFGNAVADLFGAGFDWKTGSVLALFLLGAVLALGALSARLWSLRRTVVP